jgi:hypothetical protein
VGHEDHANVARDLSADVLAECQLIATAPEKELGPIAWLVQRLVGVARQRRLAALLQPLGPRARRLAHLPAAPSSPPPPWRVMVTCALGHANIFKVGPADSPPHDEVRGQPPTEKDTLAASSAPYLAPDRQADRVLARAQTLIGATSIFGTIFTAFGFIGASRLQAAGASVAGIIISAVACLAVSLALAFAALVVERGHLDVGDPDSLWDQFSDVIARRWRLTMYSAYLFVLALLMTFIGAMLVLLSPMPHAP